MLFFQKGKLLELYENNGRIEPQEFDMKLVRGAKMSTVGVSDHGFDFWTAKLLVKGARLASLRTLSCLMQPRRIQGRARGPDRGGAGR